MLSTCRVDLDVATTSDVVVVIVLKLYALIAKDSSHCGETEGGLIRHMVEVAEILQIVFQHLSG